MTVNRFIRESECQKITSLSRVTRWRLEQEGKFPKRYKITQNTIGWLSSELDEWINSKLNNDSIDVKSKIKWMQNENNNI